MGLIDRIKARKAQPQPGWVQATNETARVVSLPVRDTHVPDLTAAYRLPGSKMQLRPIQSEIIGEAVRCRGAFVLAGVGHGKTIPSFVVGAALGARLTLLFVPAKLRQKTHDDLEQLRHHWRMPVVRVLSYNELSTDSYLLDNITAGYADSELCIVCDEAQALKAFSSARTKRMARFLDARPAVPFVALSGTMTDKSLLECAHLAEWALRERSPIPRASNGEDRPGQRHLEAWAACIDVKGQPATADWRYIAPLLAWAGTVQTGSRGNVRQTGARLAFRKRLKASPGVVRTEAGSLTTPLYIRAVDVPESAEVEEIRALVVESGETPDGEVLVDDISRWRFERQISCGFYYRWDWPGGVVDWEWMDSRARWGRHVRAELDQNACAGYDSPALISLAVMRGDAPHLKGAWMRWSAVKDRPAPPVVPVWVDPTWLKRAIDGHQGIIWYESRAVADALERLGVRTMRAGEQPPSDGQRVALSVRSHGTGYNLQAWRSALVLEPPSGGKAWEQMIGRLHRAGQPHTVTFDVVHTSEAFQAALVSARADARYIEDTTGNHQKLNAAGYQGEGLT